ncbi:hypothetical protein D3C71_1354430 [compost metagenome]
MSPKVINLTFSKSIDGYSRSSTIEIIAIPRNRPCHNRSQDVAPLRAFISVTLSINDLMGFSTYWIILQHFNPCAIAQ